MAKVQTTVTKVDHDTWCGYYIDGQLYGYSDSYNFCDEEVKNEALIRLFETCQITHRSHAEVIFQRLEDLDCWTEEGNEDVIQQGQLPYLLDDLIAHLETFSE